jgi:hypothetical protein
MSDLISRKAVKEILDDLCVVDHIWDAVDTLPTAFDIEEVIKELEEMKTKTFVSGITWNPYEFGACHAIDKVIEIVKGGVK